MMLRYFSIIFLLMTTCFHADVLGMKKEDPIDSFCEKNNVNQEQSNDLRVIRRLVNKSKWTEEDIKKYYSEKDLLLWKNFQHQDQENPLLPIANDTQNQLNERKFKMELLSQKKENSDDFDDSEDNEKKDSNNNDIYSDSIEDSNDDEDSNSIDRLVEKVEKNNRENKSKKYLVSDDSEDFSFQKIAKNNDTFDYDFVPEKPVKIKDGNLDKKIDFEEESLKDQNYLGFGKSKKYFIEQCGFTEEDLDKWESVIPQDTKPLPKFEEENLGFDQKNDLEDSVDEETFDNQPPPLPEKGDEGEIAEEEENIVGNNNPINTGVFFAPSVNDRIMAIATMAELLDLYVSNSKNTTYVKLGMLMSLLASATKSFCYLDRLLIKDENVVLFIALLASAGATVLDGKVVFKNGFNQKYRSALLALTSCEAAIRCVGVVKDLKNSVILDVANILNILRLLVKHHFAVSQNAHEKSPVATLMPAKR